MPERYSEILARCLAVEDKAYRDQVLAAQDAATRRAVRHMMAGIARRLTNYIVHAGAGDEQLTARQRRYMRNARLKAIPESWLRQRVEKMVREHFMDSGTTQHHEQERASP